MKTQTRKAVSPIIATLLLIAITVAAGVVVYVFVGGLSANLSKSGGNQVTEQISLDAYDFTSNTAPVLNLRNTGPASVTINSVYYDGSLCTSTGLVCTAPNSPITQSVAGAGGTYALSLTLATGATAGSTHTVKIVTLDGAIFTFNVIAGSSG